MVIRKVDLEIVCGVTSSMPDTKLPEVAFAGKSNVGKSSLINGLMNRKAYAKVSQKPGKTQTINYYNINDELYIVDLPGYGFANVSPAVKASWGKMIERYLRLSPQLRMIFLLVDIRHEPSANDVQMYNWIVENGFYPAIIATKLDKLSRSQANTSLARIRKKLQLGEETPVVAYSAITKQGREEIWGLIEQYVLAAEDDEQDS